MEPEYWKQGDEIPPGLRAREGVSPQLSPFPISWWGHRSRITLDDGREGMLFPLFLTKKEAKPCLIGIAASLNPLNLCTLNLLARQCETITNEIAKVKKGRKVKFTAREIIEIAPQT